MFLRSQTTRCPDLRTETNYSYKEFLHIVTQLAVNLSDTLNSGQRLALLLMQQSLLVTAVMLLRHTCAFSGCLESLGDCRYTCRAWRTCWENHQVTGAKVIVRSFMRTQGADFFFFGAGGTSGRCVFLMLDETWWQREPGRDTAAKAIRTQKDVPPFGNEWPIAPP